MPLLEKQGIKPEEVFYCAEVGIIDKFQRLGLGSAISAFRLRDVHRQGYKTLLTRTINPYTHAILEHIFSEKPGQQILKDPERGSLWFKWDFNDFNEDYTEKVVSKLE